MLNISKPEEKLIIALDGMNREESILFVSKLPRLRWVKVGLELFLNSGPDVLVDLKKRNLRVFLDLKFHDIPATMAGVTREVARRGVDFLTVHACAGFKALKETQAAAIEGATAVGLPPPKVLAVTVLTSWQSNKMANELMINQSIEERVELLAGLAYLSGISGCVCSSLEVSRLRSLYPEPFELFTPGIRLPSDVLDDQERVMSPSQAINSGASKIVVGRPITASNDPCEAFEIFCREIEDS